MKGLGLFFVGCGTVITGAKLWEVATGTLNMPFLLVLGPLFVVLGGAQYWTALRRESKTNDH